MKIRVNRAALAAALKLCASAADGRSTMPQLACVLLRAEGGKLTLKATDLNVSIATEVACSGDAGEALVGAAALSKIVDRLAGDEVLLTRKEMNLEIGAGRAKSIEPTIRAGDFPKVAEPKTSMATLDAIALRAVIDACLPAVCNDETRFHLNGVLLEFYAPGEVRGVATDGHRLHLRAQTVGGGMKSTRGVIVPKRALVVLVKLLDGATQVDIELSSQHLFARVGGTTLAAKLIDAQFPPYEQVIPTDSKLGADVDRATFADAIRRGLLVATDARGLDLDSREGELHLAATNGDRASSDVLPMDGGAGTVAHCAAPRYLAEAAHAVGGDRVAIWVGSPLAPILFARPGSAEATIAGGNLAVVMPMRRG